MKSSKRIEFTKKGHIITEDHKKFRDRLKEKHQRNKNITISSMDEIEELDSVLHLPSFINNDYVLNPVFSLNLVLADTKLYFDKNEDDIVTETIKFMNSLITS